MPVTVPVGRVRLLRAGWAGVWGGGYAVRAPMYRNRTAIKPVGYRADAAFQHGRSSWCTNGSGYRP
ncbi:hypothetical protein GCM10010171_44220 [Actinokineospora fastidiosa]|uniref:Uncharacterized protein n=1 Tax=Actinokineospora fastidiosa TaxID=1816 RepID=A0A918LGJ3_9PSEU|nr:hypothetical protein GCM10010171_44220 [Actinokineospora fastidiosa]